MRIVAELVNAADGSELWSRTFDRELKDIFAVQAEIARAVATSLELRLLGTDDSTENVATKVLKPTMPISRVSFTSSVGTLKAISRRSVSSIKQSGSILAMRWLMPSVRKRGLGLAI